MRVAASSLLVLVMAISVWALVPTRSVAAEVDLIDRATGQVIATYRHKGRIYAAGEPGREYEIRIRNDSGQRLLAVTTVDGVNVITGETARVDQAGYVLDPYGNVSIDGWRKNMSRTAAFYFTRLPDSYAARTGRPDNVGVIGVALFNERARREEFSLRGDRAANEPSAAPQAAERDAAKSESRLGTGHGRNTYSPAEYTEFERASSRPDRTIVIYYDSQRNLQAAGIIPKPKQYAQNLPNPFPGFVADP